MRLLFFLSLFFVLGSLSATPCLRPIRTPCIRTTPKPPCDPRTPINPYLYIVDYCSKNPKCPRCVCFMAWYKQCHTATVKNDLCACFGRRCPWRD